MYKDSVLNATTQPVAGRCGTSGVALVVHMGLQYLSTTDPTLNKTRLLELGLVNRRC